MKPIEEHIKEISTKVQQLIKQHIALQKENAKLSADLAESVKKEKPVMEKIAMLQMENSILKASADKMDEKERIRFEKQINQYIRDLEKCMTMLNK